MKLLRANDARSDNERKTYMPGFDPDAFPTRGDIINMYHLALGREPESLQILDERVHQPHREWLPGFFRSQEFLDKVVHPVVARRDIVGGLFDDPPAKSLIEWAANFLPLMQPGQTAVNQARNWYALFLALMTDTAFVSTLVPFSRYGDPDEFLIGLEERRLATIARRIKGGVDRFGATEIEGWAVHIDNPDLALVLDLALDGKQVAVTTTSRHREDCQRTYGGLGNNGFLMRFTLPPGSTGRVQAIVREVTTGSRIDVLTIEADRVPVDDILAIKRQLADVSTLLARIEGRLPDVLAGFSFPLAEYGQFYDTYLAAQERIRRSSDASSLWLLIDGRGSETRKIDRLLASVERQTSRMLGVTILHEQAASLEMDAIAQRWSPYFGGLRLTSSTIDNWSHSEGATVAGRQATAILLVSPEFTLHADAAARFNAAIQSGASIVYADDDEIVARASDREVHRDPVLRGAFDREILLQDSHHFDTPLAITRSLIEVIGPGDELAFRYRSLLETTFRSRSSDIVHIAAVLSHRHGERTHSNSVLKACRSALEQHLTDAGENVVIVDHDDPVGRPLPGRFRLVRPVTTGTKVAIIIGTRDRLDLLEPCVESIARSISSNRAVIELMIVDNASRDDRTRSYLDHLAAADRARILPHDGEFNWALMNNRAAAETSADVLIFLNNDTLVLTPDCWDELAAQALREAVGAVGARLLYADGTIQHAGVVLEEGRSFSSHEGAGRPGSDPGYLGRHAVLHRTSAVTGACIATRADVFQRLGGFDAVAFPVEGNDTDYCLRLGAEGYQVLYDPYATLYHLESKTRGYNVSESACRMADQVNKLLVERWSGSYPSDPFYNRHFDRLAPPFSRLGPR